MKPQTTAEPSNQAGLQILFCPKSSCETPHEINWVRLWLARQLVDSLPLPWQRYSSQAQTQQLTPRAVQRGLSKLIGQIGSLAVAPKPRGISPGRQQGTRLIPRSTCPVVKFRPPRKRCHCKDTQNAA